MNISGARLSENVQVAENGIVVNNFSQAGPSLYTLNNPGFIRQVQDYYGRLFSTPVIGDPLGIQAMERSIRNFGTPVNQRAVPPLLRGPQQFYGRTPVNINKFLGL